jgi:hypothetical protein
LAPYFVKDPLNKDSFVIPPLNLLNGESSSTSNGSTIAGASATTQQAGKPTTSTGNNINQINAIDLFDNFTDFLTKILIRLPYQIKKVCLGSSSSSSSSSTIPQTTATGGAAYYLVSLSSMQHSLNLTQIISMFEFSY